MDGPLRRALSPWRQVRVTTPRANAARTATPPREVLVFEVAGQRYGLPTEDVRELLRMVAVVPLPRAPAVIEGVINLRGRIVPVYDIRQRFCLPPRVPEPADHLILAVAGERLVALRVDRATELIRLDPEDVADPHGAVPGAEYVSWVAKLPANLVLIHDLRTFLARAEAADLDAALAAAGEGGP